MILLICWHQYRPQLATCIVVPFFQQLTGINAVMFCAPQLFASFGSGQGEALLATLIIGALNVVATLVVILTGEWHPPHPPPCCSHSMFKAHIIALRTTPFPYLSYVFLGNHSMFQRVLSFDNRILWSHIFTVLDPLHSALLPNQALSCPWHNLCAQICSSFLLSTVQYKTSTKWRYNDNPI